MSTDPASDDPSALADWLETSAPGISLLSYRSQFTLRDLISKVRDVLSSGHIHTVNYYPADPEAKAGIAMDLVAKCRKIATEETNAAILLCPLSGRIERKEEENTVAFWKNLNFQRETLGSLPARIVLCLDDTQKTYAYDYAKDLLSWCAPRFSFPCLPHASDREELRNSILPGEDFEDSAAARLTIQSLSAKWESVLASGESITQEQMRHLFYPLLGAALDLQNPGLAGALLREASHRRPHPGNEEQEAKWLDISGHVALLESDFNAAEKFLKDALEIRESLAVRNPEETKVLVELSTSLNNLANVLHEMGRFTEAEPLMRRALEIDENYLGEKNPNVAVALNNLAQLLQATDRLAEAEPLMRRALEIDESIYGPNHRSIVTCLSNFARLLHNTGRSSEAEPLLRRALKIDEASLGENHPEVAKDLNNLANLLQNTDRLAEAEPLFRRALGIIENSFGEDHLKVAITLNNLARLLQDTNRLAEAEPLMRRHLVIFIKFTGATGHNHRHLKDAVANYMHLLEGMGTKNPEFSEKLASLGPEAGWELEEWDAKLKELIENM